MTKPTLHGPGFSTYVRSVRITLAEKGVEYDFNEFNFLEGWPEGYESLHPFRKVPAFQHEDVTLFETPAIQVYVNAAFAGPPLLPEQAAERARSVQAINVLDNYAYGPLITRTFIPRAVVPMLGGTTDEAVIEGAHAECEKAVQVLNDMLQQRDFFGGSTPSLADFHILPVVDYTTQIPEGQALLESATALTSWCERMRTRESVATTKPQLG